MEKRFIFSQTCMMYFLLMWNMSKCQDTHQRCPVDISGGYIVTDYLERHCEGLPGDVCDYECDPGFIKVDYKLYCQVDGFWHSVWHPDSKTFCTKERCPSEFYGGYIDLLCSTARGSMCTYLCKTGFDNNRHSNRLTCGENGEWSPDTNSSCVKSVENRSDLTEVRSTDEGNIITIMGITAGSLIGMIAIVVFVVWIARRTSGRKSQQRVPSQVGNSCLRPREYQLHDVTNIRQQPNADRIDSVSSFESPSHNGLYVHSFVQWIPTISSSCKDPEPPPLYYETPFAPHESPPTYEEVITDPSRFILNI